MLADNIDRQRRMNVQFFILNKRIIRIGYIPLKLPILLVSKSRNIYFQRSIIRIHLFLIVLILTPPPPSVISCVQRLRLNSLKFSCKINWPEHKVPVGAFLPLTVVADRTHDDWIRSTKIVSSVTKTTNKRPYFDAISASRRVTKLTVKSVRVACCLITENFTKCAYVCSLA